MSPTGEDCGTCSEKGEPGHVGATPPLTLEGPGILLE